MTKETLLIYDNEGVIISQQSGSTSLREPVGVPFMWVEIPQNKMVVSVDVTTTPHQPIFEDLPPSEIDLLNQKVAEQEQAILELTMALAVMQGGNN